MSLPALLLLMAQAAPFGVAPVADVELATMRGGFRLPNGIDIALTVQTQTAIDGAIILRTVFRADQGPPTLTAFVPRAGTTVAAASQGTPGQGAVASNPSIAFDARNGIWVTPGLAMPGIAVLADATGQGGSDALPEGLEVAGDSVRQGGLGGLQTVALDAADISVIHFAGTAFGSAIANSGSDREIATQTSVAIDIRNAGPDVLGSSMLRAQDVAFSPMQMRGR